MFPFQNLWFLLDKHHTPPVIGDEQVQTVYMYITSIYCDNDVYATGQN